MTKLNISEQAKLKAGDLVKDLRTMERKGTLPAEVSVTMLVTSDLSERKALAKAVKDLGLSAESDVIRSSGIVDVKGAPQAILDLLVQPAIEHAQLPPKAQLMEPMNPFGGMGR